MRSELLVITNFAIFLTSEEYGIETDFDHFADNRQWGREIDTLMEDFPIYFRQQSSFPDSRKNSQLYDVSKSCLSVKHFLKITGNMLPKPRDFLIMKRYIVFSTFLELNQTFCLLRNMKIFVGIRRPSRGERVDFTVVWGRVLRFHCTWKLYHKREEAILTK